MISTTHSNSLGLFIKTAWYPQKLFIYQNYPPKEKNIPIKSIKLKGNLVISHNLSSNQAFSATHTHTFKYSNNFTKISHHTKTMALQIHHFCRPITLAPIRSLPAKQSTISGDLHQSVSLKNSISNTPRKKLRSTVTVRSSSSPAVVVVVGEVTEVGNDTFWPIVNAAGDKTVVLDMYTQW